MNGVTQQFGASSGNSCAVKDRKSIMKIVRYDEEVDALYVDLKDAPVMNTEELHPGVMVDYDKEGKIVGVEILDFKLRLQEEATSMRMEATAERS